MGFPVGPLSAACVLAGLGACAPRNTQSMQPIADALNGPRAAGTVDKNVRLYFGDQRTPRVAKKFGTYTSNKKTNGVNKTDPEACQWAFLSAQAPKPAKTHAAAITPMIFFIGKPLSFCEMSIPQITKVKSHTKV